MAATAEEIERVYAERYAPFRRAVAVIVGGEERAHDAVQEGFAGALAKRSLDRGNQVVVARLEPEPAAGRLAFGRGRIAGPAALRP